MEASKIFRIVGIMSGTSLDGMDMVLVEFMNNNRGWSFDIIKGTTYGYSEEWKNRLAFAQHLSAFDFVALHREYGAYTGNLVNEFLTESEKVDLVASHGHTVFHKPDENITFQVGCGAYLAAKSGQTVISDFRTLDIALDGQGAPLVPIGDKLLFGDFDACINLGGFANVSFDNAKGVRWAFDICPVNIVLNQLTEKYFQLPYDKGGDIGKQGEQNEDLLKELNMLPFYSIVGPKSLAREWVELNVDPILKKFSNVSCEDVICTFYHHAAEQIAKIINGNELNKVLFSGGGTYNDFLMEIIRSKTTAEIVIPKSNIIEFKEALIFAFLGLLRYLEQDNCLKSVTGATKDNVGGSIYVNKKGCS